MNVLNELLSYDIFIFDFDGTIMDTENYHCQAWNLALKEINPDSKELSIHDYFKFFHTLNNNNQQIILKNLYDIEDFNEVYKIKQINYNNIIKKNKVEFVNGMEDLLNFLINHNKKFIIVTNTSIKNIEVCKNDYPILKNAFKIYTRENFLNRKPNPECYLKILNEYPYEKKIGFEDSLPGLHALYQVSDIQPILIYNKDYYYTNYILKNYKNTILTKKYDIYQLNIDLINNNTTYISNKYQSKLFVQKMLDNNINELNKNYNNMTHIINSLTIILKNIDNNNNIYLTGMGKSGYICKKSASTWQSLSIKASYIDLPNLPHGDFGIFRDNDILLLISNGGNTSEIIYILKYIKDNLKKNINIITITGNKNSEMEKYSNFTFILDNIIEMDEINMTPSTSSMIFMNILDAIGINLRKDITKDEFKLYHPSGSLGKR
jgi:D-arabinose 5-phosphate isomerase GutQ/beta-phosphoglucomutase-like phosphatase (HAD superfamily)